MKRSLASACLAGLLSVACSSGEPSIMGPTSYSSSSSVRTNDGLVEKYYTVGGTVQSVNKPLHLLEGARVWVAGEENDGRTTVSNVGGAFSLALKPGNVTLIVTMDGYEPWSTTLAVFENRPDIHAMLRPTP